MAGVCLDQSETEMARRELFGTLPDGSPVDIIHLRGAGGVEMSVMTYGCVIISLLAPDRKGRSGNIVLGFDRLDRYVRESPYFGAVVGRYANRIADARFVLDGRVCRLGPNEPPNHLHGGFSGFDKQTWDAEIAAAGSGVVFRRTSPDGEEGYPGTLDVQVTYTITNRNVLQVAYEAVTDAPTHVNLTQHSYFNLRGAEDGLVANVLGHCLSINADLYLPVTDRLIPTGALAPVANTPFDFHDPVALGSRNGGNYDHTFVLNRAGADLTLAARVFEPVTGRTLDVRTTEPGLQVYAGGDHRGLCLETQHYPDSPNHPDFPSTVLRPGQRYVSRTEFAFGIG